jgi:hypothetical protein
MRLTIDTTEQSLILEMKGERRVLGLYTREAF